MKQKDKQKDNAIPTEAVLWTAIKKAKTLDEANSIADMAKADPRLQLRLKRAAETMFEVSVAVSGEQS